MSKGVAVVRRRKGFTLVELLAVIAIIMVLIGLVMVGMNVVQGSARRNSTKAAMETARAVLSESDATGNTQRVKALYSDPTTGLPVFYSLPVTAIQGVCSPDNTVRQTGVFLMTPQGAPPTASTANVMRALAMAPNNKKTFDKLPQGRLVLMVNPQKPTDTAPVLADGWDNPLLFVPPGGLIVNLSGIGPRLVTSAGVFDPNNPPADWNLIQARLRPFFVSAGPDGDFSKGDDNIYSFEN